MSRRPSHVVVGNTFRGSKRATEWISKATTWIDVTASESQVMGSFSQAFFADFTLCTVIRTVGMLGIAFDLNFISNQVYAGAAGICMVREDARAANAVPDPFTNASDDVWFYHQFFAGQLDDRTDVDIRMDSHFVIDSKAQRKIVDGDAMMFMVEGGGETDGFDAIMQVRLLLKLH